MKLAEPGPPGKLVIKMQAEKQLEALQTDKTGKWNVVNKCECGTTNVMSHSYPTRLQANKSKQI